HHLLELSDPLDEPHHAVRVRRGICRDRRSVAQQRCFESTVDAAADIAIGRPLEEELRQLCGRRIHRALQEIAPLAVESAAARGFAHACAIDEYPPGLDLDGQAAPAAR